jgi:hypothetical protein
MTGSQFKTLRTLLFLVVLGLFAVATSNLRGSAVPEAQAGDSKWTCYVTDRLASPGEAEEWKGARQATHALNFVAADATAGNVISFPLGKGSDVYVLCVN